MRRFFLIALFLLLTSCTRAARPIEDRPWLPAASPSSPHTNHTGTPTPFLPPTRIPGAPIYTPTPDAPHPLPTVEEGAKQHVVQWGDTLGSIALLYQVDMDELMRVNGITDPDRLDVGQVLVIPQTTPGAPGTDFKIIPNSELVYGPASAIFDVAGFIAQKGGYLAAYQETVDDEPLSGAEIVQRIAQNYSVNPRLLLAVLEYQSGWVTQSAPAERDYPIGWRDPRRAGLYRQLAWAANELNRGYYLWRVSGVARWMLAGGEVVPINPTINAGTAAVQYLFAQLYDRAGWDVAVGPSGVFTTYLGLFGYPFDYAIEPLLPPDLTQPPLGLPFEPGAPWYFTGGPHGGWDDGSAWAALDFTPTGPVATCWPSDAWVVAAADGLIVRADHGAVVQDLDGDGYEQTGWTLLYMHIAAQDRVAPNTYLHRGDRIGHPSCEGGIANATHLHLARRYNGEWIPADGALPFNLEGWVSSGNGVPYDGFLTQGDRRLEACECRAETNTLQR